MIDEHHQIPILCKNCGGPVEPGADLALRCPYCGTDDRLPGHELDRALELKRRVREAARSVAQLAGMEASLSHIYEDRRAFLRVVTPILILFVLLTIWSIISAWPMITAAPARLRAALGIYAALGPAFVGGFALSAAVALIVGRANYRNRVRPLILARPARKPDAPTRCRACGGDLPDQRGPLTRCEYCDTYNLVTDEIQKRRSELLEREERAYGNRSGRAAGRVVQGTIHMNRWFVACLIMTYSAVVALTFLAGHLMGQ